MHSPFPGMDPYLEKASLWTDFHNSLAYEIRVQLTPKIQPNYFASLESYVTYERVVIGSSPKTPIVRPDVGVWQPKQSGTSPTAVLDPPVFSPSVENTAVVEIELSLRRVTIHHTATEELVSVIEILSPANKQPSHKMYHTYLDKRRDILNSNINLLEIDLLRGGTRPPLDAPVPAASYYIMLSRVTTRPIVNVWPIQLSDPLPVVPIPLREPDPDAPLDVGQAVRDVYTRSGYRVRINYDEPLPPPTLSETDATLVNEIIKNQ